MIPPIEKLTVEQYEEFQNALQKAFTSLDGFKQLVRFTFNENLSAILPNANLNNIAFDLIEWAESQGKINALIAGASKRNSQNPTLKAFIDKLTIKNEPQGNKYFDTSVLIADLSPEDILRLRAKTYQDFYYKRDFDEELYEKIVAGESILLLGNSLAGKTRAIFEALKKLAKQQSNTLILFPQNVFLENNLPIPTQEGFRHIAFIEDIDDYYRNDKTNHRNYDKMIQTLSLKQVQILATCRTGPEYQEYKKISAAKTREIFSTLYIQKVNRSVVKEMEQEMGKDVEETEFDGNIGSVFMNLTKMRERYEVLEKDTKNKTARLAIQILRALRAFYFASNFTSKSTYLKEAILDYCLRMEAGKYASPEKESDTELGQKMLKQIRKEKEKEVEKFHEKLPFSLMLLQSDENNLNFIEEKGHWIGIEEVYLEKLVKYNPITIAKNIYDFYDAKGEKEKKGFFVKTNNYNVLMKSQSYHFAEQTFYELRDKGIVPNADTYNVLIEKAPNFELAKKWYALLKKRELLPNEATCLEMINKCPDFQTASTYIAQNLDILNLDKENPEIDMAYQRLTDCVVLHLHSQAQIHSYLTTFFDRAIPISSFVLNRIIKNAKAKQRVATYLKWITDFQIEVDKVTINHLLAKCQNLSEGLDLLQNERFKKLPLDTSVLGYLLQTCQSLGERLNLLEDEKFKNLPLDIGILNRLLEKCHTLGKGLDLLQDERFKNLPWDTGILNSLLGRCQSSGEGLNLLQDERFKNLPLDVGILNSLLEKCRNLGEGLDLLQDERFKNLPWGIAILNSLLLKCQNLGEGLGLLQDERFKNLPWDTSILNSLVRKCQSLGEGLGLLQDERFKNLPLDTGVLDHLLQRCQSLGESLGLLQDERFKNLALDTSVLRIMIHKVNSLQEYHLFLSLPLFVEKYTSIPTFACFDIHFKSFEEVITYYQTSDAKPRFMVNHLLYVLLSQKLLKTPSHANEFLVLIHQRLKERYTLEGRVEIYQQIKDTHIYPDLQELLKDYIYE